MSTSCSCPRCPLWCMCTVQRRPFLDMAWVRATARRETTIEHRCALPPSSWLTPLSGALRHDHRGSHAASPYAWSDSAPSRHVTRGKLPSHRCPPLSPGKGASSVGLGSVAILTQPMPSPCRTATPLRRASSRCCGRARVVVSISVARNCSLCVAPSSSSHPGRMTISSVPVPGSRGPSTLS
jgi:hypothetical protein